MKRCTFRVENIGANAPVGLNAILVMPTVEAARQRLLNDDPIWKRGRLVRARKTGRRSTPWGRILMRVV